MMQQLRKLPIKSRVKITSQGHVRWKLIGQIDSSSVVNILVGRD